MPKKDAKKTEKKKPVAKKEAQPPKAEKKVKPKPKPIAKEVVEEKVVSEEPKQYFGITAELVLDIKDVEVFEKPMKEVYLNDGVMMRMSEKELETGLKQGENNK